MSEYLGRIEGPIEVAAYQAVEELHDAMQVVDANGVDNEESRLAIIHAVETIDSSNVAAYDYIVSPRDSSKVEAFKHAPRGGWESIETPEELRMRRMFDMSRGLLKFYDPEHRLIIIFSHDVDIQPVIRDPRT